MDEIFKEIESNYYKEKVETNDLPGRLVSNHNKDANSLTYTDWITNQYENMVNLSKERGLKLNFSKLDLFVYIKENDKLSEDLRNQLIVYMNSSYHTKMVPVIDLLDKSKNIDLSNIYITSWEDKLTKWNTYTALTRTSNTQLVQKEVEMLDLNGNKIRYFKSINEAHKFLNVAGHSGKIFKCCEGLLDEAYGYKWKYAEKLETDIF